MEKMEIIIHWLSYTYLIYAFGRTALSKLYQRDNIMSKMQFLGVNKLWVSIIGIGELLGVTFLLLGLFNAPIKNIGILILVFFALGAFIFHMIRKDYSFYHPSLLMCIVTTLILITSKSHI